MPSNPVGRHNAEAPAATLVKTEAPQAALDTNLRVTSGIETGAIDHATLLLLPERNTRCAGYVITSGKLAQLADALGTTLVAANVARAHM